MKNHPPHKYCAGREEDELPVVPVKKKIDAKKFLETAKFLKKNYQEEQEYLRRQELGLPEKTHGRIEKIDIRFPINIVDKLNEIIDKLNNL